MLTHVIQHTNVEVPSLSLEGCHNSLQSSGMSSLSFSSHENFRQLLKAWLNYKLSCQSGWQLPILGRTFFIRRRSSIAHFPSYFLLEQCAFSGGIFGLASLILKKYIFWQIFWRIESLLELTVCDYWLYTNNQNQLRVNSVRFAVAMGCTRYQFFWKI